MWGVCGENFDEENWAVWEASLRMRALSLFLPLFSWESGRRCRPRRTKFVLCGSENRRRRAKLRRPREAQLSKTHNVLSKRTKKIIHRTKAATAQELSPLDAIEETVSELNSSVETTDPARGTREISSPAGDFLQREGEQSGCQQRAAAIPIDADAVKRGFTVRDTAKDASFGNNF